MIIFTKFSKCIWLIFKYRLFFILGFIPYLGILKVFMKADSVSQGKRLTRFIEELGPYFVKLGQLLSVRSDLIGENYANCLTNLQENTKRYNFKQVKATLLDALGHEINIKEADLIAAGSVAEVYKVVINNQVVAVKVLKPNIHKKFNHDINFLSRLFKIAQNNFQDSQRLKIFKLIDLLKKIASFELDLRFEAAASEEQKAAFYDLAELYIPEIYWEYSNKNVLVTEWVDGIKINTPNGLSEYNLNPEEIIYKIYYIFFKQVITTGFFHGDLHPGNIIITKEGKVALIDFGIMGRLSGNTRNNVYEVWKAFLNQDYEAAANIHFKAGWVNKAYSKEDFSLAVRAMIDPIFKKVNKNKAFVSSLMEQLFTITRMFGMEIQSELLLLQKNMFLLEGMAQKLAPELNVWEFSKQIINRDEFEINLFNKAKNICYDADNYVAEINGFIKENIKYLPNLLANKNTSINSGSFNKYNYAMMLIIILILVVLLWKI